MTANLTLRVTCRAYHVTPNAETQPLAGKMVRVHEWEDGRVALRCEGNLLPHSIFDKNPIVTQGAIVENTRLGAVLAAIQASQTQRDQARLASRELPLREKDRLRAAGARAGTPDAEACSTTLGFDGEHGVTPRPARLAAPGTSLAKRINWTPQGVRPCTPGSRSR